MTRATDYTNTSQQRFLQLVDLLAGHELQGLEPSAIAKALGCTASVTTRDLDNLRTAGWAELHPNGRTWRLTPHVVEISLKHASAIRAGRQDLSDVEQRYSRVCNQQDQP